MSAIRNKIERLLDALIQVVESSVDRIGDPNRVKYLQDALKMADQRLAEFARDNARLERELEFAKPHRISCQGVAPSDGEIDLDRHLDAYWWKK